MYITEIKTLSETQPTKMDFIQTQEIHQHNTRCALNNLIDIPRSRTSFYQTYSIRSKLAIASNRIEYELGFSFKDYDIKSIKNIF